MKDKLICPFTKSKIKCFSAYLKVKPVEFGIEKLQLKYLVYLETFGDIVTKEKFQNYYEVQQYSLPMFFKEFCLSYTMTTFLIEHHGCKKRTKSETAIIAAIKAKETNLKRYGVDQTFKVPEFDKKRKESYKKKYGVDNPFKQKNFIKIIEKSFKRKYGISRREFYSIKGKEMWDKKNEEEKEIAIKQRASGNSNNKLKALGKARLGSRLEKRVAICLLDFDIKTTTQFLIKNWKFDFFLEDFNVLLEIYGDHIHANPLIYKEDDILALNKKTCKEIWEYDKKRLDHARSLGYTVVVIWEREMKFLDSDGLFNLISKKIYDSFEN